MVIDEVRIQFLVITAIQRITNHQLSDKMLVELLTLAVFLEAFEFLNRENFLQLIKV